MPRFGPTGQPAGGFALGGARSPGAGPPLVFFFGDPRGPPPLPRLKSWARWGRFLRCFNFSRRGFSPPSPLRPLFFVSPPPGGGSPRGFSVVPFWGRFTKAVVTVVVFQRPRFFGPPPVGDTGVPPAPRTASEPPFGGSPGGGKGGVRGQRRTLSLFFWGGPPTCFIIEKEIIITQKISI